MESNQLVESLVGIIDSIIGKKLSNPNKIKFGIDLYWILVGKKLSLLIDHYYLTKVEFLRFLKKLKSLNPSLIGISLNLDFNFILTKEYFENLKSFDELNIIDTSPNLLKPELIIEESSPIMLEFKQEFQNLIQIYNHQETKELISIKEASQNLIIPLTGYLLNYPIIYYNNNLNSESYLDNCLANNLLNVYKFIASIKGTKEYLITSFSIPEELETDRLTQVIENWKSRTQNLAINTKLDNTNNHIEFTIVKNQVRLDKVCL